MMKIKIREDIPFLITDFEPGVNEFIEIAAEYFLYKWTADFLSRNNIHNDLHDVLPIYEEQITWLWGEVAKGIPPEDQLRHIDGLRDVAYNRFLSFQKLNKEYWIRDLQKYKRECPNCHRIFLASRKDSQYCDDCRGKAHVENYREKKYGAKPDVKVCEYRGCGKEFSPKTRRARFCSDVCRVLENRERKSISRRQSPTTAP